MGWTYYGYNTPRTYAEEKQEIEKLCTWETDSAVRRPVQTSKIGNVWYVAVKVMPKVGYTLTDSTYAIDSDGTYTFCAVFLTSRSEGEWGYKDMSEDMGPNAAKAPASLIKKLSAIVDQNSYAIKWRESCLSYAASKPPSLQIGDLIKTKPIRLDNGRTIESFRVDSYRHRGQNRKVFYSLENGGTYRLNRRYLTGLEIVERA